MMPLVLGGWIASFAVLASFFYHHVPENVWTEPHTYRVEQGTDYSTNEPLPPSMEPAYPPGTFVTVVPMYLGEVQPGRVIAFNNCFSKILIAVGQSAPPFLHRVVSIGADAHGWYAITKGDSNPESDVCRVREGDLLGIVP